MTEERICSTCGRANPLDQPRCVNCGQRAKGVMLVAEKSPVASAWWSGSASHEGVIPPPPQVRDEILRADAVRLDEERRKVERERRAAEARERQARQVAQRAQPVASTSRVTGTQATAVDCARCGVPLDATSSGTGFSFCLLCGAEAPIAGQRRETRSAFEVAGETPFTQTNVGSTGSVGTSVTTAPIRGSRSPVGAAVMSFFLPGIGQCLNGQAAKGALLLLVFFLASTVFHFLSMGIPMLIVRGVAAADAYRIAEKRRRGLSVRDGEWDLG